MRLKFSPSSTPYRRHSDPPTSPWQCLRRDLIRSVPVNRSEPAGTSRSLGQFRELDRGHHHRDAGKQSGQPLQDGAVPLDQRLGLLDLSATGLRIGQRGAGNRQRLPRGKWDPQSTTPGDRWARAIATATSAAICGPEPVRLCPVGACDPTGLAKRTRGPSFHLPNLRC